MPLHPMQRFQAYYAGADGALHMPPYGKGKGYAGADSALHMPPDGNGKGYDMPPCAPIAHHMYPGADSAHYGKGCGGHAMPHGAQGADSADCGRKGAASAKGSKGNPCHKGGKDKMGKGKTGKDKGQDKGKGDGTRSRPPTWP